MKNDRDGCETERGRKMNCNPNGVNYLIKFKYLTGRIRSQLSKHFGGV